jgi:hypothetical protein
MTYFWTQTALPDLLSGLLGDVATALTATPAGAVNRAVVLPGVDIPWDDCQCGMLAVAHRGTFRSRNFPQSAQDVYTKCDDFTMVYDLTMVVMRCTTGVNTNNVLPKPAQTLADMATQASDAYTVWTILDCALRQLQDVSLINNYIINQQTTLGPQGLCAGTQTDFKVGLFPPCPCNAP